MPIYLVAGGWASHRAFEAGGTFILREFVLFDRRHFSEIKHGVGRISQSLLSARLRTLEAAGILERRPNRAGRGWEYHPTQAGRELEQVLNDLGIWAQHWIELRQEHCDPAFLMQTVHSLLIPERLPHSPTTVRFEFTLQPKSYWLVIDGEQPELCYCDPGREEDLIVTVDEQVFGGVILGRVGFAEAIERGAIRLAGPPELMRAFPTWLGMSRFARYGAEARWGTSRIAAAV